MSWIFVAWSVGLRVGGNAESMISGFFFSFIFSATRRCVRVCGDLWGDSGARSCWSGFCLSETEASASDGRIFFLFASDFQAFVRLSDLYLASRILFFLT